MMDTCLVVGPFQCNCHILVCPESGHGVVIDPGDEAGRIFSKIQELNQHHSKPIQIKALLHTHAHLDHCGATRNLCDQITHGFSQGSGREIAPAHLRTPAPAPGPAPSLALDLAASPAAVPSAPFIAVHLEDEPLYQALQMQGKMFGIEYDPPVPINYYLKDNEILNIGTLKLEIIHTPGHSPGSICIRVHQNNASQVAESLYSGDTLFHGSVGRTDLWGGDQHVLFKSIKNRLFVLDGDTLLLPGHGSSSRIGVEKKSNPFFQ